MLQLPNLMLLHLLVSFWQKRKFHSFLLWKFLCRSEVNSAATNTWGVWTEFPNGLDCLTQCNMNVNCTSQKCNKYCNFGSQSNWIYRTIMCENGFKYFCNDCDLFLAYAINGGSFLANFPTICVGRRSNPSEMAWRSPVLIALVTAGQPCYGACRQRTPSALPMGIAWPHSCTGCKARLVHLHAITTDSRIPFQLHFCSQGGEKVPWCILLWLRQI